MPLRNLVFIARAKKPTRDHFSTATAVIGRGGFGGRSIRHAAALPRPSRRCAPAPASAAFRGLACHPARSVGPPARCLRDSGSCRYLSNFQSPTSNFYFARVFRAAKRWAGEGSAPSARARLGPSLRVAARPTREGCRRSLPGRGDVDHKRVGLPSNPPTQPIEPKFTPVVGRDIPNAYCSKSGGQGRVRTSVGR